MPCYGGTTAQPNNMHYPGVVGTLAWSTYKRCLTTVAQSHSLSNKHHQAWSAQHVGLVSVTRDILCLLQWCLCVSQQMDGNLQFTSYILDQHAFMVVVSLLRCSNVQMMPFSLLNFGNSQQALAGMVSMLAWSTFQMMLLTVVWLVT